MRCRQLVDYLLVMSKPKSSIELTHGNTAKNFFEMLKLGIFGAQKTFTGGCIEKQITHFNCGAARMRRRCYHGLHITPFHSHLPGFHLPLLGASEREPQHRANRSKRFTTKA